MPDCDVNLAPSPEWVATVARNNEAMKHVEQVVNTSPDILAAFEEEKQPTDTDKEVHNWFRTDRISDIFSNFVLQNFPRLFMFLWGKKILDACESIIPDDDKFGESNRIIKMYLNERTRIARKTAAKDVEEIRQRATVKLVAPIKA